MGFKMAPSESTKVVLGVLALAGIGIALYYLNRQLRKNKKSKKEATEQDVTTAEEESGGAENASETSEPTTVAESIPTTDTSILSASMSGWEEVKPMSESFIEVKSSPSSFAQPGSTAGDMATSQMGPDSMGSFIEVGLEKEPSKQGSEQGPTDDNSGAGDAGRTGAEKASEAGGEEGKPPEAAAVDENRATASAGQLTSTVQRERSNTDEVQSLPSEDTVSSGEAPSFEQINGSDDATSLAGSEGVEGAEHHPDVRFMPLTGQSQQMVESLQSFEQVSMDSSGVKMSAESGDSLPSFEKLSGAEGAMSMSRVDSSIVVIPESSEGVSQSSETRQAEEQTEGGERSKKGEAEKKESEEEPENKEKSEGILEMDETPVAEAFKPLVPEETPSVEKPQAQGEPQAPSQSDVEEQPAQAPSQTDAEEKPPRAPRPLSEGEGSEAFQSFEMLQKKGLGGTGGSQEYYSSDSLQSFATATTSSGRQDFYSPISSPPTVDSSFDNTSFKSFDDSTSYDTEASEDLTFYDVNASGRKTPQSPQDRTPTNSPAPQEMGGGDAEFVKTPSTEVSSGMESSVIMAETPAREGARGDEMLQQQEQTAGETAPAPSVSEKEDSPSENRMLPIDRDKMTDAILQAQNDPGSMEIGQLQVLVELLKQDDRTLLNTTLQCLIKASAFTINVNILEVCDGPAEVARLLERFAKEIQSGSAKSGQGQTEGSPSLETLFLSTARTANNFAMDIKSQSQLEGTIPVLTDLLMTEGISETVTLASLQPLTNLSSTNTYHGHYTRLLQQLYSFLDTSQSPSLRLQCLKLLVNLSLNADMVPHMLAAKAPGCLLDLLDINYDVELLLRTVTFLANVMAILQERDLSPSNLPPDEKAPSPETLFSALMALDRRDALRNKVFRLTRHDSTDIQYQASRLYGYVTSSK